MQPSHELQRYILFWNSLSLKAMVIVTHISYCCKVGGGGDGGRKGKGEEGRADLAQDLSWGKENDRLKFFHANKNFSFHHASMKSLLSNITHNKQIFEIFQWQLTCAAPLKIPEIYRNFRQFYTERHQFWLSG